MLCHASYVSLISAHKPSCRTQCGGNQKTNATQMKLRGTLGPIGSNNHGNNESSVGKVAAHGHKRGELTSDNNHRSVCAPGQNRGKGMTPIENKHRLGRRS